MIFIHINKNKATRPHPRWM